MLLTLSSVINTTEGTLTQIMLYYKTKLIFHSFKTNQEILL